MLTKGGAKLLDFGLAKLKGPLRPGADGSTLVTQPASSTAPGTILGTLQYMAPEQLTGKNTDHRADIWSFGCVLYELLARRRAFERDSQAALISAILSSEPRPLPDNGVDVPPVMEPTARGRRPAAPAGFARRPCVQLCLFARRAAGGRTRACAHRRGAHVGNPLTFTRASRSRFGFRQPSVISLRGAAVGAATKRRVTRRTAGTIRTTRAPSGERTL